MSGRELAINRLKSLEKEWSRLDQSSNLSRSTLENILAEFRIIALELAEITIFPVVYGYSKEL